MQKYLKIKLAFIIAAAIVFSGCAFGQAAKKTEIKLMENQPAQAPSENVSPQDLNANKADNAAAPENNPNPEKKADSPTAASSAPAATSTTSTQDTAPKTTDNSADSSNATNSTKFKITDRLVSWGFTKSSGRTIDTIIIHSSYNAVGSDPHSLDDIINKEYKPNGVSPHYIISREGVVYRLVADQNIAYHAGVSKVPDGRTNVNDFSIGIEVVETQSESPNAAQYASLKSLISYLKGQYKIKYILGHSDIAPGRKDDPWNFSWSNVGGREK